jgi:parallel beta-helix repeat protein
MRRFLSLLLALGLVLSLNLVTALPVLAVPEVWVDDDFDASTPGWGVTHFDSIQDGIDAADLGGATVHVAAGTYNEDITLANGVSVLGAGAGVTIIDGTGLNPVVTAGSTVAAGMVLDGFTITGGSTSYGGGMYNNNASPTVSNCVFTGNSAFSGGGAIYISSSSHPTIINNTLITPSPATRPPAAAPSTPTVS